MFNTVQATHPDVNRLQENWRPKLNKLVAAPLFDGVIVGPIGPGGTLPGAYSFTHNLGRTPVGWFVIDITGLDSNADPGVNLHRTSWSNLSITLSFTAACTITLWVF